MGRCTSLIEIIKIVCYFKNKFKKLIFWCLCLYVSAVTPSPKEMKTYFDSGFVFSCRVCSTQRYLVDPTVHLIHIWSCCYKCNCSVKHNKLCFLCLLPFHSWYQRMLSTHLVNFSEMFMLHTIIFHAKKKPKFYMLQW